MLEVLKHFLCRFFRQEALKRKIRRCFWPIHGLSRAIQMLSVKPPLSNLIFNILHWNMSVSWVWQAYYLEVQARVKKKGNLRLTACTVQNSPHLSILKCVITCAFIKPGGLWAISKSICSTRRNTQERKTKLCTL